MEYRQLNLFKEKFLREHFFTDEDANCFFSVVDNKSVLFDKYVGPAAFFV